MRRALLLVACTACVDDADPPWQLAHDRIVAVRSEPPALLPGEVARLDALVAHAGGPTTIEVPTAATASNAPADLFTAVHFNIDHWQVDGPGELQLAQARTELGLRADAPVPLAVTIQVPGPLYATKLVMLGASYGNPTATVEIDGATAPASLVLGAHREISLHVDADHARWFTSCGELRAADAATATLVTAGACSGELVVVVRDEQGGTFWQRVSLAIEL